MNGRKTTGSGLPRIAVALLAFSFLAATPLPTAWNHWRYWRTIDLPSVAEPRLTGVTVAPEVFAHAGRDLADLRVIDDQGSETPFIVMMREGSTRSEPRSTILHERSFAPGLYTQVVIEVPDRTVFHNSLSVQTSEQDFMEWVSVEASDDGHIWRIVQQRAPIFRFWKDGRQGTQVVRYSENNARFLRVRILDGSKQFPIEGATVLYRTQETPERRLQLDAEVTLVSQPKRSVSAWTADLGSAEAPLSDVKFEVAAPAEFVRCVELWGSEDNRKWQRFAQGEIYRYQSNDAHAENLEISIAYGGVQLRYWRIEILNHNDAPLAGVKPRLLSIPRHIIFEQQAGRSYRLLYGQSRATSPEYDLSRRLNPKQMEGAVSGQLGPEEVNLAWSDPRPWTEKYESVLWLAMGAAVLLLGYSAIRSLRRTAQGSAS